MLLFDLGWIPRCINNRRKLFYEFKCSSLDSVKNNYKQLRNKIMSMVKEVKMHVK